MLKLLSARPSSLLYLSRIELTSVSKNDPGTELELFTDPDMCLFIEEGVKRWDFNDLEYWDMVDQTAGLCI